MRIGIMGAHYGHIRGMFHSATNAKNGEIVGFVEADNTIYNSYKTDHNIPRYSTLEEMLEKGRPELVLEGVTHQEKVDVIEKCAAAGVHVLLDKPLCRSFEDWMRIKIAVDTYKICLSMFFTSRSYPTFMALRNSVQAGELGEIVSLISTHPHKLSEQAPRWYFDPSVYAGTFHDLACHGLDQVRWLTGAECIGVHALGTCKKHNVPPRKLKMDHIQASFELSNGACTLLTADWLTPKDSPSFGDTRFILMGTKGSAHLRAYAGNHLLIVTDKKGTYEPDLPTGGNPVFVHNLIDALSRDEENFISTNDVLEVAKACLMAEESARRGGEFLKIN